MSYLIKVVLKNGKQITFQNENDPGRLSQMTGQFVTFVKNKYRNTETSIRVEEIVLWQVAKEEELKS